MKTPSIDVKKDEEGNIVSRLSLSSKASLDQMNVILKGVSQWSKWFEGLIVEGKDLGVQNDNSGRMTEVVLLAPLLNVKWKIMSLFRIHEEDDHLCVTGRNVEGGDWANLEFRLSIKKNVDKPGKRTTIHLTTVSSSKDLPVPLSSVALMLKVAKPLIKKCIHNAVEKSFVLGK